MPQNALPFDVNFDPEGGLMVPAGADPEAGQAVAPGQSFTYTWVVPDEVRGQSVRGVGEGCDPPSLRRPWTFPLLEPRALPDLQVFLCL